jgi:hypothetical protein
MRISNLEMEFRRFKRGNVKNRRGLNKSIDELAKWIDDCFTKIDADTFYSKTIKRVYYTQTINYKDYYSPKGITFPSTIFDNVGEKDYFIIMHTASQIIETMKMVNLSAIKYNLNYLYIEFVDGSIWFNQMSFLPTYKNATDGKDIFEEKGIRDKGTIDILINCGYEKYNLSPNTVLDDSQKAFEQIDSLNKGGVTQPTPTAQPTPTPQNTQSTTFKIGDIVEYIGSDKTNYKNGDIGEIIDIPTGLGNVVYGVRIKNSNLDFNIPIYLLKLLQQTPQNTQSSQQTTNFKVGDRVEYLMDNSQNIKKGTIGVVTRLGNFSVVDVDFDLGNKQIKPYSVIDTELRLIEFKIGDSVKYIGANTSLVKKGDVGILKGRYNITDYNVEFPNGKSVLINKDYLELFTDNSNIINDNSIQKFQVGDEVYQFSEGTKDFYEVKLCIKINNEWEYNLETVGKGTLWFKVKQQNLFFSDESSRYDNEFNVGDKVRVVIPNNNYFGNIGTITKEISAPSQISSSNPSGKIYSVKYELYGTNANGNEIQGQFEGKDLILIESANALQPTLNLSDYYNDAKQQFHVGDEVYQFNDIRNTYVVVKCKLVDNKWIYDVQDMDSAKYDFGVIQQNLVLKDESKRINNEFVVGDRVRVAFIISSHFGNSGLVKSVTTEKTYVSSKNPSGKIYLVDYDNYGFYGDTVNKNGSWEGRDLILVESASTQVPTNPSTQATTNPPTPMTPSTNAGARVKLTIGEQDLQNQINDLTDLLNLTPEYDFEDRIAISQELTTLQDQMNIYIADSTIQNEFYNTGKINKDQSIIDLMLSADCVKLSPRPTNTNLYQNGFNPNGKPTALNKFNYDLIHTEQFQRWFGNYGLAYNYSKIGESNLGLSSQVVNSDGEPLVVYMGVGREFEKITFARFPIGYFAVNEAYAEWFATTKADDGVGYNLPFFLNIRRPLDFSIFGIDEVSPKDFFDWLYLETGMTGKELGFDDRYFLPNCPSLEVWRYIRFTPNFLNKLKEYKICDGIHFYENNPSNPVNANNYMTEVWTIFYSNQCKLASQDRSEMILSANNSFLMKKGGLVK